MSRREFRAIRVPARDVSIDDSAIIPPAREPRLWQTVAEVAGFLAVLVFAVGIWSLS